MDDSSSLDSNGMDTISSSRIRLKPNDIVYLRIPICMHGSVYNANNRPGGDADCMSIAGDCIKGCKTRAKFFVEIKIQVFSISNFSKFFSIFKICQPFLPRASRQQLLPPPT